MKDSTQPIPEPQETPAHLAENPYYARKRRTALALFALASGGFGLGTTEFASMGLLPFISTSLDITIPEAGWSVSAYALGVVIGAPVLTTLTARFERRFLLVALMVTFVLANLITVFANSLDFLLAARFLAGLPHGAYFGVAAVVAASLVSPTKRGTAMARLMLGLTLANIIGVPIVAAFGAAFGWRSAYVLIAGCGAITVVLLCLCVPRVPAPEKTSALREIQALGRPQVWLALLAGALGFGGMFALYTYISPTMTELAGFPLESIPWVLALYGVGMTVGSLVAGPCIDRSINKSAFFGMVLTGALLLVFGFFAHIPAIALAVIFVIGTAAALVTTGLQAWLLRESSDAPNLSAAMNHAAFNLANALGAYLGGIVIALGWGYRAPSLMGVGLTLLGLSVLCFTLLLRRRRFRTILRLK